MRNDLGVASNNKLLFGRVESVMCDSFMWWMLLILLSADEAAAGDRAEQSSLNVPRDWLLVSEWVSYKIMTNYDQMTQNMNTNWRSKVEVKMFLTWYIGT